MDTRVLIALLLASILVLSGATANSTCPNVTSSTYLAQRDNNFTTLLCKYSLGMTSVSPKSFFHSTDTAIRWYYNSADGMAEITSNTRRGEGINFMLQDEGAKNVHLNISLPLGHGRIEAEMNYTCGCAGYNATAVQVLIVEPLKDPGVPSVHTAEIGKPYDLRSPFALGPNRHLLTSSWSRESDIDGASVAAGHGNRNLSLHFDSVTAEDGACTPYTHALEVVIPAVPAKPVIQPVRPNVSRLVLYNGALKGGRTYLKYSHTGRPLDYVNIDWHVNISDSLYSRKDSSDKRTSEFSFIQSELDGELDGPLSVIRATFNVSLHIAEMGLNLTHQDSATVIFNILKISQSQNFQVVFERPSFTVLRARITYQQPIPAGFDFKVVFYISGEMVQSVIGEMDSSGQVELISFDNVGTLSSVTARMEFVYSDDRFMGPEVTTAIPPYCPECIIGAVCGAVLLVVSCITVGVIAVAVRRYRRRKHERQTYAPPDGTSIHHSRRDSCTSEHPVSLYSGTGVDLGSTIHPSYPCMLVPMAMQDTCSCSHVMPPNGRYYVPGNIRGMRPIHDHHTRVCNSALPEEYRESSVDRQPPMRQRSYSEGQLADNLQIQRLEGSRPDVHHYDIPRRSSTTRVNNECFNAVPRGGQNSSEMDSVSTGVQSNRPLIDNSNNDRLSNATRSEGEDVTVA